MFKFRYHGWRPSFEPFEHHLTIPGDHKILDDPYRIYNRKAQHEDEDFVNECYSSMDTLLVFAGLFSAVIAAFIQETYQQLKSSDKDPASSVPAYAIRKRADVIIGPPTTTSVAVNTLLMSSLVLSLITALAAMLVKQWARQYRIGLGDDILAWNVARKRHARYVGLEDSNLRLFVYWIPMFMHVALLFFMIGLVLWLKSLNAIVTFSVITGIVSTGVLLYGILACVPSFRSNSPFQWPVARAVQVLFRRCEIVEPENIVEVVLVDEAPTGLTGVISMNEAFIGEESMPHSINDVDYAIMIYIMQHTSTFWEVEVALDHMRTFHIQKLWEIQTITVDGGAILRACRDLADSCWAHDGREGYILTQTMEERAVRVCRFLEWFYIRLSFSQRRKLTDWPTSHVADALESKAFKNDCLYNMVLALSVQSKLHHVTLQGSPCQLCLSRHPFGNLGDTYLSEKRDDGILWHRMQELVTSIIIADSECLLYYSGIKAKEDYEEGLCERERLVRKWKQKREDNFPILKSYLANEMEKGVTTLNLPWFQRLHVAVDPAAIV